METTIPFVNISIWVIAKAFVLLSLLIYIVFALVVIKQVSLMTDTLDLGFESLLKLVAILHLAFAILIFIFALGIL